MMRFPAFTPIQTATDFESFLTAFNTARALTDDEPILLPSILNPASERLLDPVPPVGSPGLPLAQAVEIPPIHQPPRRERVFDVPSIRAADFQLRLTHALYVGRNQWSQAYRGQLQNEKSGKSVNIVLKLFQESLYDRPGFEGMTNVYDDWVPATVVAQTEAWAYETLLDVQGTFIPHSYGFYLFSLPNGESTIGHVMEEIGGLNVEEYIEDKDKEDINIFFNLGDAIAWALFAIYPYGVLHGDVKGHNLRIQTRDGHPFVILLDFSLCAQPISGDQSPSDVEIRGLASQCVDIHGLLRAEAGATYEISKAWAEKWVEEEGLRGDVWRILMSEW